MTTPIFTATGAGAEEHIHDTAWSRRRFLQAAVAASLTTTMLPSWLSDPADAATVGQDEGILAVLYLEGGLDALDVLVPTSGLQRYLYDTLRGSLAIPSTDLLSVRDAWGLNAALPRLSARYDAGDVALVRGVGLPDEDLSHFSAAARMMSGRSGAGTTGWLGRHLDVTADGSRPFRAVSLSRGIPLHLRSERSDVLALPTDVAMWGSDLSRRYERSAADAVRAFAAEPTGLGPLGDRIANDAAAAVDHAGVATSLRTGPGASEPLVRDLEMAATAINADLGVQFVSVSGSGFDTHARQDRDGPRLLADVDLGIDRFFSTLAPAFRNRTTLLVVSEFGRRPAANGSLGTDHGRAGMSLLVGEKVAGGLHGEQPSLLGLDDRGNLAPTVDFREIYASVLDGWLGGDARATLDGSFNRHELFEGRPGSA